MLEAAIFGAIAQSALIVGALLAWKFPSLKKPFVVGVLMAFGAGAVISAVAIDLVAVSYDEAGAGPTAIGVSIGALLYFGIVALLERKGDGEKSLDVEGIVSSEIAAVEAAATASGGAVSHGEGEGHGASKKEARNLTIGMVIDGVPESIAVGLTLHTATAGISAALVGSIFISAVPEAIGISAALLAGGIAMASILLRFSAVVVIGAVFAAIGYTLLANASDATQAIIQSVAAGALLVVVINEMIPIAVRSVKGWAGIVGTGGFVFSAALTWATGG